MIFLINNAQKPKIHVHFVFSAPKMKAFSAFISFFVLYCAHLFVPLSLDHWHDVQV